MKIKDQIILGIEDIKNMRCPWPLKVVFFSIIPAIVLIGLFYSVNNYHKMQSFDWIPIILIIQTIIILIQVKIIRTQSKYSKLPYIPEFDIESRYISKSEQHKKDGYCVWLENNGDVAYRVNCQIKIGKYEKSLDKLFFEKIAKKGQTVILGYTDKEKFTREPIRIFFSYYDKVGNHIYSRWFKLKDKNYFNVILTGQDH